MHRFLFLVLLFYGLTQTAAFDAGRGTRRFIPSRRVIDTSPALQIQFDTLVREEEEITTGRLFPDFVEKTRQRRDDVLQYVHEREKSLNETLSNRTAAIAQTWTEAKTAWSPRLEEYLSYGHMDIEEIALMRANVSFFGTNHTLLHVYYGNWLRDYSQLIDVSTLNIAIKGTSLKTTRYWWTHLINVLAWPTFRVLSLPPMTREDVGTYRAEHHLDNPRTIEAGEHLDPDLRGAWEPEETAIDVQRWMKKYLRTEGGGWATTSAYIKEQIHLSATLYKEEATRPKAFRHFGSALHPLEDLFAHSNLIELAAIELGYTEVFPWVGEATAFPCPTPEDHTKLCFPMVTGLHSHGLIDQKINLLNMLVDKLTAIAEQQKRGWHDLMKTYSTRIAKRLARTFEEVRGDAMMQRTAIFDDPFSTDPTHSQMNKDHGTQPLHTPAALMAIKSVQHVAEAMVQVWLGLAPESLVTDRFLAYFTHPAQMQAGTAAYAHTMGVFQEWVQDHGHLLKFTTREAAEKGRARVPIMAGLTKRDDLPDVLDAMWHNHDDEEEGHCHHLLDLQDSPEDGEVDF